MTEDNPDYFVDHTQISRSGRDVSLTTVTDISPEMVLMQKVSLYVKSIQAGTSFDDTTLNSIWRKRLANVIGD